MEELKHARERVDLRPRVRGPRGFLQAVDHLPALLALDLNLIRKRRPQRREQREANLAQVLGSLGALKRGEEHGTRGALLDHGLPGLGPARQHRRHEDVEGVHVNLGVIPGVSRGSQVVQQELVQMPGFLRAEPVDHLRHRGRLRRTPGPVRVSRRVGRVVTQRELRPAPLIEIVAGSLETVPGVDGGHARGVRRSLGVADPDVTPDLVTAEPAQDLDDGDGRTAGGS